MRRAEEEDGCRNAILRSEELVNLGKMLVLGMCEDGTDCTSSGLGESGSSAYWRRSEMDEESYSSVTPTAWRAEGYSLELREYCS